MHKIRGLIIFLLMALALLSRPCFVRANDVGGIRINEIMWQGSSVSSADEWLELYNDSNESISLKNWVIFDEVKNSLMVTLSDGEVLPHDYFLISNNAKDHKFSKGESILNVDPDYIDSNISLSNSEFKISLRDLTGMSVDTAGDKKEPSGGEFNGRAASMQRVRYDISGGDREAWRSSMEQKNLDLGALEYATPKASGKVIYDLNLKTDRIKIGESEKLVFSYKYLDQSSEFSSLAVTISDLLGHSLTEKSLLFGQTEFEFSKSVCYPNAKISFFDQNGLYFAHDFKINCYQLSNQVKLYEVLPHPKSTDWNQDKTADSSDEWIELVNFSDSKVILEGWKIADLSGKTFEILSGDISSYGFKAFYKNQTGISLNDTGEKLSLYDPEGKLADSIDILNSSTKYDMSFAKWGDSWFFTTSPTPNAVNIINQPTVQSNPSFENLTEAEGKTVNFSSEVLAVERNSFSVLVDQKAINVTLSDGSNLPNKGDMISLYGVSHSGSNPYIVASSYQITKTAVSSRGNPETLSSSEAIINSEETEKSIKTKKIISKKITPVILAPVVLGSMTMRSLGSFNVISFLLYSSGAIFFLLTISIYDFCCRK